MEPIIIPDTPTEIAAAVSMKPVLAYQPQPTSFISQETLFA
jgi:hypothetical protein